MAEDCDSTDLSTAIKNGYKIIVPTIQKFRYILDETKNITDKSFAIIIDESHSSTSGKNMSAVTTVLADEPEEELDSIEDQLADEINRHGKQNNISMIAFTATPKNKHFKFLELHIMKVNQRLFIFTE